MPIKEIFIIIGQKTFPAKHLYDAVDDDVGLRQ